MITAETMSAVELDAAQDVINKYHRAAQELTALREAYGDLARAYGVGESLDMMYAVAESHDEAKAALTLAGAR